MADLRTAETCGNRFYYVRLRNNASFCAFQKTGRVDRKSAVIRTSVSEISSSLPQTSDMQLKVLA